MLIGEYNHTLDPKRRLMIPARLRKDLGERVILTKGLDQCLFIYPMQEWERLTAKLSQLPMGQANTRGFVRSFLAGAVEAEFDSLGRVLIPEYLRQFAGLKQKAVVAGVHTRLEVWDEERWGAYKTELEKNTDMIAEKLGELGLY